MDKNITGVVDNPAIAKIQSNILDIIVNPVLGLATAVSFCLFAYGILRFLINRTTNPEDATKGKAHILWGGLGLFILLSIWSILISLGSFFDSKIWFVK